MGLLLRNLLLALVSLAPVVHSGSGQSYDSSSQPRTGIVRASRRTLVDDGGAFLALGTTLFWGLWGFEHDRARLARNLAAIADGGFDYIRVLGAVSWHDRPVNPRTPDWGDRVAAFTDWAYDTYHLRVQWTLFGDTRHTPGMADRRAVVDRWAVAVEGRHHKVFAVEIANEGWKNGFPGERGRAELKALAARLARTYPGLRATTAPPSTACEEQTSYYRGARASLLTLHFSRSLKERGVWQPVIEPWRATANRCAGVPSASSSNEPIGPYSSVNEDRDPLRLAAGAAVTWLAGAGAYVLHTGAGVRGGGEDIHKRGRPANLWDVQNWEATTAALRRVRAVLPSDLPDWSRVDQRHGRHPFRTRTIGGESPLIGHYAAFKGRRFVTAAVGIRHETSLAARRPMTVRIVNPATGRVHPRRDLASDGVLTLTPDVPAVLILGEWR